MCASTRPTLNYGTFRATRFDAYVPITFAFGVNLIAIFARLKHGSRRQNWMQYISSFFCSSALTRQIEQSQLSDFALSQRRNPESCDEWNPQWNFRLTHE